MSNIGEKVILFEYKIFIFLVVEVDASTLHIPIILKIPHTEKASSKIAFFQNVVVMEGEERLLSMQTATDTRLAP